MKSIDQRRLSLISMILQLRRELDSLKRSGYGKSWVSTDTGSAKYVCPDLFGGKPPW